MNRYMVCVPEPGGKAPIPVEVAVEKRKHLGWSLSVMSFGDIGTTPAHFSIILPAPGKSEAIAEVAAALERDPEGMWASPVIEGT